MRLFCFVILEHTNKFITWINPNPRIFFSFSLFFSLPHCFQQGHSAAFYRDHPQDIRHRTIQSRKPPPLSTHLMKGDPDSATSPSKYKKRNSPVLPPPDVTLTTPVTEVQRIRVIESLREEDFQGFLINLDSKVDENEKEKNEKNNRRNNSKASAPTKEEALKLALNRRRDRVDRNLSVAQDDEDEDQAMSKKSEITRKGFKKGIQSDKDAEKYSRMKTPMTTATMTTSDSEDEFVRPTRRKPRKKKRDKSDSGTEKSPVRRPKLTTNEEEADAFVEERNEGKTKVDSYVLKQWERSQEKAQTKKRAKSTSQENDSNSIEVGMQKLLHRSSTGFSIDDVRNALENARVIGTSDMDLDQISSDETRKNLTGQALIDHKKKMALKWQRMATKIMAQETVVGDPDVDRALLAVKFSKLGKSIPEVDEANVAERTRHLMGNSKTENNQIKTTKRKLVVPGTPAKTEGRRSDGLGEIKPSNKSKGLKSTPTNTFEKQKTISHQPTIDSKIPKPKSPTRRPMLSVKPLKSDSHKQELVPVNESKSRLPSPTKKEGAANGRLQRQPSPSKREGSKGGSNAELLSFKDAANSIKPKKSDKRTTQRSNKDIDSNYDSGTNSTPKLPPLREAMALPRTEETSVESSKRLELLNAARNARPIPIGPSAVGPEQNVKKQGSQRTSGRAHLPLTTKKPKKKMPGEEDADQEFYKAFKLLYVDLPVPEDELPCE